MSLTYHYITIIAPFVCLQDVNGTPFTESSWTRYVQEIIEEHTEASVGPNVLRSAFVTFLMDCRVEAHEETQRAVAHTMRHLTYYYISKSFIYYYAWLCPCVRSSVHTCKKRKRKPHARAPGFTFNLPVTSEVHGHRSQVKIPRVCILSAKRC